MLISTQTDALRQSFGDCETVRILAANGYDAIDYSMFVMNDPAHPLNGEDWYSIIKEVRATADECKIFFNQSHAPFPSYIGGKPEYNDFIIKAIRRSIEITAALGGKTVIVHPTTIRNDPDRQKALNMEIYHAIEDTCAKYGVRAALENMWDYDGEAKKIIHAACSTAEQFNDYADTLGRENFTCCLDLGHCGLVGETAAAMLTDMGGERVTALHVHDNDNYHDSHTLPFLMKLDWKAITKALRDINYAGELTFEADNFIASFPRELRPAASKFMLETGRTLVKMIEEA